MARPKQAGSRSAKAAAFMRKAIQYYEAGDLQKAQKNVAKYLSADPRNPDANHLAGLIAHKTGQSETAVKLISRALEANPRIAMAHNNLGEAYRELKQFSEAEACYRKAVDLDPAQTGFHNNLGIALVAQGKVDEAINVYDTAIKANPRDAMVHTNRGNALMELGKHNEAVEAHRTALAIQPSSRDAQTNLAVTYQVIGDVDRARALFMQVLKHDQTNVTALSSLARICETIGETDEAERLLNILISQDPDDRDHYLTLADMLRLADRPDEAVAVFERHLEHDPDSTDSRVQIASIWRAAGQQPRARELLREILQNAPDNVAARTVLAQMIKHTSDEENIAGLKALKENDELTVGQKASVNFSLGKAMEEISDLDAAIECYITANRHRRSEYSYSHDETVTDFNKIINAFTYDTAARNKNSGASSDRPIFIVGMPRSGTSLVEQIISSHSQVFGAGELSTLSSVAVRVFANKEVPYPDALPECDGKILRDIGEMYIELTTRRFGDAPHMTDKMPHNFMNVGLIRLALPNAKIVHCQRHPMDTCLSIFKNAFSESHNYAYNMEELGTYYREYLRLMEHWRSVFPGAMYEISYESLVDDTEPQARRLLEYCELDWEPACLEFYKTKRVVNTVSATQVRQPIYKSSVALWKRYGERLQPLIDALGDAVPPDS